MDSLKREDRPDAWEESDRLYKPTMNGGGGGCSELPNLNFNKQNAKGWMGAVSVLGLNQSFFVSASLFL